MHSDVYVVTKREEEKEFASDLLPCDQNPGESVLQGYSSHPVVLLALWFRAAERRRQGEKQKHSSKEDQKSGTGGQAGLAPAHPHRFLFPYGLQPLGKSLT